MKQKQVKGAANGAKNAKTNKKEVPPKKVQEVVEENDEEEEEEVVTKKAAVAKKPAKKPPANKKGAKAQKVEEEPEPEEEVEEEEEHEDEDDEEQQDDEEMEAGDDDEEMEAGDDDEEEEEDPTLPSQVKSGEIPSNVLNSKVIHISKLPKNCKTIDITEAFAKYGAIDQIHLVTTPGGAVANLVFKTEKGAKAALDAKESIKVLGSAIKMSLKKDKKKETNLYDIERGVYVRNLKSGTTEEEIKTHFNSCGEIETVKCMSLRTLHSAYVVFKEKSSVAAALKLHNSILNGVHILVVANTPDSNRKWTDRYVEKRTIKVVNKQQLEKVESKKLEIILKKYGNIEHFDILCSNNILALVTYETEEAAEKALELNGTTVKDIEFEVEYFHPIYKTSIFVSNLPKDCTKEDLEEFFSKAGEISSIYTKKPGVATIRFKDSDGYCKSFLYHESRLNGNYISIHPFSYRKPTINHHNNKRNNFKRGAGSNDRVFRPKKPRNHL